MDIKLSGKKGNRWQRIFFIEDNETVGELEIEDCGETKKLWSFYIYEPYRHKGFGLQAIQKTIEFIKQTYKDVNVWLYVFKDNIPAVKIYKKVGFEVQEDKDEKTTYSMILTV